MLNIVSYFLRVWLNPICKKRKRYLQQAQQIQYQRGGMLIWGFSTVIDAASKQMGGLQPEHTQFSTWRFEKLWKA